MNRKTFIHIALLILGTLVGLIFAQSFGEILLIRAGVSDLNAYAEKLQRNAIRVSQQGERAISIVAADHLPFCSPEEINLMRGLVYKSSEIKDIGRLKDNKFVCSSEIGLLPVPMTQSGPDVAFRNMRVFASHPLEIAHDVKGFIVQVRDVNIVLNPDAFGDLDEPNRSFAAFFYDSRTRTLIQGFGQKMPLSNDDIAQGRLLERNGIAYRPLCSAQAWVCVVASEPHDAIVARNQPLHAALLLAGALLGDTTILALLLFYQRHRSQKQQLRRALHRGSLSLVYQPIVDIHTRAIVGAEALARWTDESGDVVSPDIFIALAEEQGFIGELTRYVAQRALSELSGLLTRGDFRLTINISSHDLADPKFAPFLSQCLAAVNVQPSALGLELTERSTANRQAAIDAIASLRRAGYTIYIDDFGTGYSSLAYLRDLSVDFIKIDRAFTATIGTSAITESLIPQILHLAEQLRLAVVVEGIETREQAEFFRAADKEILGQGWFYSRPVSAANLHQVIQDSLQTPALEPVEVDR